MYGRKGMLKQKILLLFWKFYIIHQFSCSPSKCWNYFQYRWMLKNLMTLNLGTELVLPSPRTHTLAMISSPKSFTLQIQVTLFFQRVLKFHFKHCWRTHHLCNHNYKPFETLEHYDYYDSTLIRVILLFLPVWIGK